MLEPKPPAGKHFDFRHAHSFNLPGEGCRSMMNNPSKPGCLCPLWRIIRYTRVISAGELAVLDELARFKRKLGRKALLAGDMKTGIVALMQGIGFYRCWELPLF